LVGGDPLRKGNRAMSGGGSRLQKNYKSDRRVVNLDREVGTHITGDHPRPKVRRGG